MPEAERKKPTERQWQLNRIVTNSESEADDLLYEHIQRWDRFDKDELASTATKEQIELVKKALKHLRNAEKVFRQLCVSAYDEWNELYKENPYW